MKTTPEMTQLLRGAREDLRFASSYVDDVVRTVTTDEGGIRRTLTSAVRRAENAIKAVKQATPDLFQDEAGKRAANGCCVTCGGYGCGGGCDENHTLASLVKAFRDASEGDSGDLEHDAACALANFVEKTLTNGVVRA